MNSVILSGRLTKDPVVKYSAGESQMAIARYTLAVDRAKKGEADFIQCVAFNKNGEFAEKYLYKGMKIIVSGHIQTGSYQNKEGQTVYTTEVIADHQEFCESKGAKPANNDGFITATEDAALPFN